GGGAGGLDGREKWRGGRRHWDGWRGWRVRRWWPGGLFGWRNRRLARQPRGGFESASQSILDARCLVDDPLLLALAVRAHPPRDEPNVEAGGDRQPQPPEDEHRVIHAPPSSHTHYPPRLWPRT